MRTSSHGAALQPALFLLHCLMLGSLCIILTHHLLDWVQQLPGVLCYVIKLTMMCAHDEACHLLHLTCMLHASMMAC